jgi:hypothetical protein
MSLTIISPVKARQALIAIYKSTCQYCNQRFSDDQLQVDHIDPISKGGTDTLENYTLACKQCNALKHSMKLELLGRTALINQAKNKCWSILRHIQNTQEHRFDHPPFQVNYAIFKSDELVEVDLDSDSESIAIITDSDRRRYAHLAQSKCNSNNYKWHGFGDFWIHALEKINPLAIHFLPILEQNGEWHTKTNDLFGQHGILTLMLYNGKLPNGTPWEKVNEFLCWLSQCTIHYNSIQFCRLVDDWQTNNVDEQTDKVTIRMLILKRELAQAIRSLVKFNKRH